MRTLTLTLVAGLALPGISAVQAADLDYGVLRGPDYETEAAVVDWSGVYVGGFAGYTSASLGFKNAFEPLVAKALKDTTAETEFNASTLLAPISARVGGASYGAFAGYNYQFDDTVIGVEVDYTRFDLSGSTSDSISRFKTTSGGYLETVALSGIAATKIEDYGTIRARAGYAFGSLLPYITGGLAIGRAQVSDQVNIQYYGYDQATYQANLANTTGAPAYVNRFGYASFNSTSPGASTPAAPYVVRRASTKTVGGIALGAGVEWALTQNIVLRGEYQYVLFNDFDSHKVNINTVRAGAAIKF
ncbi:outer membrane protein [Methylobacterium iners]|uniref:Outer membrane protein beta-barrel domain-containing protein n=1 Tax=Methylobacterium iners TaxID=418707 RepID=A0ABQ4S009_9HYPH|nr:outer membrane beta-barrel protein [Methylobacterium iners]GJD96443.1 hypothetical protein OCOJLMKI_3664 [Methylobacterium iners]